MPNAVRSNPSLPTIEKSDALYARGRGLIPAGTQTLAKGTGQHVNGVAPKFLERGKGARVWDVDGNEFLDLNMAIGPISLGYCYPKVDQAIRSQLEKGISFSLVHPLEVEVAELFREVIPGAEMVRYSKTGADVTTAAVRIARAYTGRNKVVCCGYHGWHDWYISVTPRDAGIPQPSKELTHTFQYNDIDSLEAAIDEDTACVIMEPVTFEPPHREFLQKVRALCNDRGVVLVFDEMWTGFRLATGGAQQYFDVQADLATFSKAVANGMPLSVLSGRRELMQLCDEDIFFFTTFGGEALSLAAAKATIEEIRDQGVTDHIARLGRRTQEGLSALFSELRLDYLKCIGLPARTMVTFDAKAGEPLEVKSLLQQELIQRGILWSGFHVFSFSHTDSDVDYLLEAYREALPVVDRAVRDQQVRASIKGEPLQPVFRKTRGFHSKPKA